MSVRTVERGSPAPRVTPQEQLISDLRKLFKWRKQAKKLYQRIDKITDELLKKVGPDKEWEIAPGRYAKLVDNFAQKNKCFRAHGINRFEFVEEER